MINLGIGSSISRLQLFGFVLISVQSAIVQKCLDAYHILLRTRFSCLILEMEYFNKDYILLFLS